MLLCYFTVAISHYPILTHSVTLVMPPCYWVMTNAFGGSLSFGEYSAFIDRMLDQGARTIYFFNLFDIPKDSGVREKLVVRSQFIRTGKSPGVWH